MSRSARKLHVNVSVVLKLHVTILVALTLLISLAGSLALVRPAFAAGFQLSGRVTDQSSNPLSGATIAIIDPSSSATVASATTDASGNYALTILSGAYNVQVTPPSGSAFGPAVVLNRSITADTVLNFVLIPTGSASLSGRVLDELGNPLPGQQVTLSPAAGGGGSSSTSDATGHYAFHVAPGSYTLSMLGSNTPGSRNAPQFYELFGQGAISLTQDTTADLTLPAKRVSVHVQDPAGNPVAGVTLGTTEPFESNLALGPYSVSGFSIANSAPTDASGNTVLWLFPTTTTPYVFTATPPANSPFVTFNLPNVSFQTDISEIVILQFIHAGPVTTATTSPAPNAQGVFPGPVTVTLSASAVPGATVASTFYTLDGGPQQTYTAPFTVSGDGSHTVMYWSVDNAGVFEIHKQFNIRIASLAITTPSPLPSGTIGVPYSVTLTASGGTQPYTWSLASGALPLGLTLDPATGVISGTPTTAGTFGFTIRVTDSSKQTVTTSFTLAPPAPSGTAGSSYSVPVAIPAPPSSDGTPSGTATCASYSIVSGALPPGVTLDPTTGVISGTPINGGTYSFTVGCAISANETVTKDFTITINNPAPILTSLDPLSANAGGSGITLVVTGTGFVTSSAVNWNGTSRPTTYYSSTQLTADISAQDLAATGSASVTVTNPDPNGGTSNALTFTINPPDTTPPVIVPTVSPAPNAAGWNNSTVSVTWAVSDPESGIASSTGCGPTTVTSETTSTTLNCSATNGAGLSASQRVTVKLDETAPTTTATPAGVRGDNNWYRSAVDVTLAATDGASGSGIAATYYAVDNVACAPAALSACTTYSGAVHVDTDGQHTLYFFSRDVAGNVEAQRSLTFKLDQTAPGPTKDTLSGGTSGANGWYTASPSIALSSSDATSQVAATYYQFVAHGNIAPTSALPGAWLSYSAAFNAPAGDSDLYAFSVDNAGNVEAAVNLGEFKVDGVAPTTMAIPTGITGSNGWFTDTVTVTLTATDNAGGSGVQRITYSATGAQPISATDVAGDSTTFTITAEGQTTITFAAMDAAGNREILEQLVVKLDRTGPTISDAQANPNPAAINTPITLTATLTDPGAGASGVASASYTLDGGAPVSMSAQAGAAFNQPTVAVTASLAPFSVAGVHTICVSGADVAGNVSTPGCLLLAVYDPSAGFVTGGGWIDSPSGACRLTTACQGAVGRANFGFVAKYQQGANIPTGQTEFQFQAGSFNFHSTNYQWLVVSGAKAQYKGTGTINGAGSYTFMLTATDGSLPGGGGVDKFRIKITDSAGNVVYDNQMGAADTADPATALGGGNIIIHSS